MTAQTADSAPQHDFQALTSDLVSAYVSNNSIPVTELPALIQSIHATLTTLHSGATAPKAAEVNLTPAVPIKRSVTPDAIICLEDGKKFKTLRRHLMATYQMSPEQYRAKWNLPHDYPMVAPNYAAQRSMLAKEIGLGNTGGRRAAAASAASDDTVKSDAPAKRTRGPNKPKAEQRQAA
jgi:predicted transcriptional regulator